MKTDGGQAEGRSKLWMETEEQVDGGCRIEKWKIRKNRKRIQEEDEGEDDKTKGGMEECWWEGEIPHLRMVCVSVCVDI